jgi:hypothetical protein
MQHQGLSTPNFALTGWDPLNTTLFGKPAGGYLCGNGAVTAQGRRLAVVNSWTTDVAFVVVDVTDPLHPVKVGEYELRGVKTYDAAMTPDGQHVVVADDLQAGPNEDPRADGANVAAATESTGPSPASLESPGTSSFLVPPPAPTPSRTIPVSLWFKDACTDVWAQRGPEEQLPMEPGVVMVGIQDPKNPTFEAFSPTPVIGPHSVSTSEVDNTTYVIASITNLEQFTCYFAIYEVQNVPVGEARLVLESVVDAGQNGLAAPTTTATTLNGHVDGTIIKHPVTGKLTAYLDDWNGGLMIVDLTNIHVPQVISTWTDKGPEGGNVHSSVPIPGLWDGRHYVIAGQEFTSRPVNRPTGWIWIVDDTDPAKPVEAGRWTLPVDTQPDWGSNELFSTHYFQLLNRTLFVAMYHGGLWAVDLRNASDIHQPRTIGVYVPAKVPTNPPKVNWAGQIRAYPYVLDVKTYPNGEVVTFDSTSGAYVLSFNPNELPPLLPEWPAEGRTHES